jgi:serine/threonine protein kinase
VASGLTFLHDQGILHGDVKGQNILVGEGPRAMLCDFGLSKIVEEAHVSSKGGLGTLRWQSPELMEGGPRSYESDVYAYGITIYQVSRLVSV